MNTLNVANPAMPATWLSGSAAGDTDKPAKKHRLSPHLDKRDDATDLPLSKRSCSLQMGTAASATAGFTPTPDPLISYVKARDPVAEGKIISLMQARRNAARENTTFNVPQFATLVDNMERDIRARMSAVAINDDETREAMGRFVGLLEECRKQGFPYRKTVLTAAKYTLLITRLHWDEYATRFLSLRLGKEDSLEDGSGHPAGPLADVLDDEIFQRPKQLDSIGAWLSDDISEIPAFLDEPSLMLYPVFDELAAEDFNLISPYPFYLLGVSHKKYMWADGNQCTPAAFLGHDCYHTRLMWFAFQQWVEKVKATFLRVWVDEPSISNIAHQKVIREKVYLRDQIEALAAVVPEALSKELRDMLFDKGHEFPSCMEHLSERAAPRKYVAPAQKAIVSIKNAVPEAYLGDFRLWLQGHAVSLLDPVPAKTLQDQAKKYWETKTSEDGHEPS